MITREELLDFVKYRYGTQPDHPFSGDPGQAALRHPRTGRWYGLILTVPGNKLGLAGAEPIEIINLKCEPELIRFLRNDPGVFPAYHMNKTHWLSIRLDSAFPRDELLHLIELSHELTS